MEASNIRWDRASVEELKRWLSPPAEEHVSDQEDTNTLTFPWPITVTDQKTVWGSSKSATVQTTLSFDEIPEAEDYEIRLAIVKETPEVDYVVPTPPFGSISDWILNGSAQLVGDTVSLVRNDVYQGGDMINPSKVSNWATISIKATITYNPAMHSGSESPGFAFALLDSDPTHVAYRTIAAGAGTDPHPYDTSYVGASNGYGFKFYSAPGFGLDNTLYSAYIAVTDPWTGPSFFESSSVSDVVTTSSGGYDLSGAGNPMDIEAVWTRTGTNSATCQLIVNGSLVYSPSTSMWVPEQFWVVISAGNYTTYSEIIVSNPIVTATGSGVIIGGTPVTPIEPGSGTGGSGGAIGAGQSTTMPTTDPSGWTRIWSEDFSTDVPLGGFVANGSEDLIGGNPYANKLRMYPNGWPDSSGNGRYSPERTVSVANSIMNIYLHAEGGQAYVAAILPKLAHSFKFGRIDIRLRAEASHGYKMAPLLWPDNNTWPDFGEIDWPEIDNLGSAPSGFMHYAQHSGGQDVRNGTGIDTTQWHIYTTEWTSSHVRFFCDGTQIGSDCTTVIPQTAMHYVAQFETSLLAGNRPGSTDKSNVQIDWIVLYQ